MRQQTRQAAAGELEVISFPEREKTKQEIKLEKSKSDLVDTMRELVEVERMTGHEGLSARVYITFTSILMDAVHLAKEEAQERSLHHVRDT